MLSAIESITQVCARLEGVMLSATRQLTAETGKLLLADKGLSDPGELSPTQRKRWRARTKSVTRHEIEAAIGWRPGEVIDLVALANTPAHVSHPVRRALETGEASWPLARRYFRACAALPHEDSAAIANALFGTDPAHSVTERLNAEGDWANGPWRHQEFHRALNREVAKAKTADPDAEARARRTARDRADVRVQCDADGSADVIIGCTTAQGAAIADRIEKAARAARHAGDPRTLRQLRSAIATALLLHGTLDFTDLPEDPDNLTPEQSAHLTKILHGLPTANLNIIVPLTTLLGTTPDPDHQGPDRHGPDLQGPDHQGPDLPAGSAFTTHGHPPGAPQRGHPCPPPPCPPPPDPGTGAGAGTVTGPGAGTGAGAKVGVGEVIGRYPMFLSAQALRNLLATPGSVLHRILTDPATGNCVERSTTAYRFTGAQRAQIQAADVFCRAPGCLHPGAHAQIDH